MAQDSTLRETLRVFLQDKLNENTKSIEFVLGKDFYQVSDEITKIKLIDGTFRTVEDTFTMAMIDDFLGTPIPIPNSRLISYTIPIVILANTKLENDYFDNLKEALEEFTTALLPQQGVPPVEQDGFRFVTNATEYTNTERTVRINGIEYIKYTLTAFITSSTNILYGNDLKYEMGIKGGSLIEIFPLERTHTRSAVTEAKQILGSKDVTSINRNNIWSGQFSVFWAKPNAITNTIIEWVEKEDTAYTQNTVFDWKTTWPESIIGQRDVILEDATIIPTVGNGILIVFTIKKANPILG